jgi:hypothetical protein
MTAVLIYIISFYHSGVGVFLLFINMNFHQDKSQIFLRSLEAGGVLPGPDLSWTHGHWTTWLEKSHMINDIEKLLFVPLQVSFSLSSSLLGGLGLDE